MGSSPTFFPFDTCSKNTVEPGVERLLFSEFNKAV